MLKEQTLESQIGHNKKKKGKKELDHFLWLGFQPITICVGVLPSVGILLSNEKADRISSPRNLEHLVAVMNGTSGLKVSKDKENSILPVSNRPFVASDSDDFHSETRSKFFGRFRKPKVSISECIGGNWCLLIGCYITT